MKDAVSENFKCGMMIILHEDDAIRPATTIKVGEFDRRVIVSLA